MIVLPVVRPFGERKPRHRSYWTVLMLGLCSHEFCWPRRAADGHYYQVCLLCGAKYEYDWKSMQRMERMDSELETTSASGLLSSNKSAHLRTAPRLRLLLELEPAHRIFFRNLADLLLFRSTSPIATTSRPAPFWGDVFVYSRVPWWWLLESMLCHMIAVVAMVNLSQGWAREQLQQRRAFNKSYVVSYYPPSQSFPALGSSRSRVRARPKRQPGSAYQATIRVAPEHTQRIIRPPEIKLTESARPTIVASNPAPPAMPLSATGRSQLTVPAGPTSVAAPPPDVNHAMTPRPGLPQTPGVAPPPDVEAFSSRPALTALNAAVVPPPPAVQGAIRKVGDINIGQSEIIEPSPRLPMYAQRAIAGMGQATLGGPATLVVPPPPSVTHSGTLAGGRASSLSSAGLQVVSPAPSVQDAGSSATAGRLIAMDIHPAVVPPPPPPPPVIDNPSGPATQELPVRLIGLALALPSSSFFSNYEVFIAERRLSKDESQLIKLVYISLPYQRRLSEYGLNNSRVYKLRVTRDPTCDETLLQMTWPQTDEPHRDSQDSTDPPALSSHKGNSMLPCYRTTADDYRRALSRAR